jgi:hypothetical protein
MKETPRRRIAVTSSLNEISTDPLGNRVVDRDLLLRLSPAPGKIFKDDVERFAFTHYGRTIQRRYF